ncbi:hypothetical protein IM40_04090 [Candidatus Paracaedimonas acanthamoebae]|nr:hypothetical protein IM40_04090 [Candidatus Paracaedimonas acanthamoebae]
MNTLKYLGIMTVILFIPGCSSTEGPETAILLPEAPPLEHPLLTTEILQQTSLTCRQQINQVWQKRFSIPKEKQKNFYEMIGRASQNCNDLIEASKCLRASTSQYTSYQQALKNAQSFIDGFPANSFYQPNSSSQTVLLEPDHLEE